MIYWLKKIILLMQNSDQKKSVYKRLLKIVERWNLSMMSNLSLIFTSLSFFPRRTVLFTWYFKHM